MIEILPALAFAIAGFLFGHKAFGCFVPFFWERNNLKVKIIFLGIKKPRV